MKKKNLIFNTISVFLGVFVLLIVGINSSSKSWLIRGDSEPYSITFNSGTNKIGTEPFKPLTFYSGTGEVKTGLNNSVQFDYKDFTNQPTSWQLIKIGGSFENIEPISGMTSISITKANTDAHFGIYWSNSQTFDSSRYVEFDTTTSLSVSTDFDDYLPNYIKVVIKGTKNASISNMKIEFSCINHYPTVDAFSSNSTMGSVSGEGIYFVGSNVALSATANTGYQFIGWYEDDVLLSTQTPYSFVMSFINRSIEGRFTYLSYNLVVTSEDTNKGVVSGSGTYDFTEEVMITATPYQGYSFVGWYQGSTLISNQATYIFNMPHNSLSYVAKFNPNPYVLTLINDNPDYGTISGGNTYNYKQSVSLSASPHLGYSFIGWYEDDELVSSANPYNFTMPYDDLEYSAKFSVNTYELTLTSSDETKGSVTGSGTYSYNSEVEIIATTYEGNEFLGWYSGETLISSDATHIFNMPYNDLSYVAKFVKQYKVEVYNVSEEWGSVSGEGDYGYTTTVALTAIPNEGYYLEAWYDENFNEISNDLLYTFTMPEYDVLLYITFTDVKPLEAGDNYYLGTYPQTKITDSSLISSLNTLSGTLPTSSNSQSWTSYNYYISSSNTAKFMWYQDVSVDDDLYRGVYFTSYRPYLTTSSSSADYSYQDNNGYYINNRYWFKFEPISWDVLSVNEETGPLVLSSKIIDSQEYYHSSSSRTIEGQTVYANNYKESNIRTWLNNSFLNTAFSSSEQSLIKTTNVDNSVYSTGYDPNQYATTNTDDKLFLPSYRDVVNADYGFTNNASRVRSATDYAEAMGVYVSSGNSFWWLRSPSSRYSNNARNVDNDGDFHSGSVDITGLGLLPAFRINR